MDEIEDYCRKMWQKAFNTDYHVNVQPHSGANANTAAYLAVLKPGDTVLSMNLENGGHLSHGLNANISGKLYNFIHYDVDENGLIDYDDLAKKIDYWIENEAERKQMETKYAEHAENYRIEKSMKKIEGMFEDAIREYRKN